jgi:hypothetical protein
MSGTWSFINVPDRKSQEYQYADIFFRVNTTLSGFAFLTHEYITKHGRQQYIQTTQAWRTNGEAEPFLRIPYELLMPNGRGKALTRKEIYVADKWEYVKVAVEAYLQ